MEFCQKLFSKMQQLLDTSHYCKIAPHIQGNRGLFAEKIVVQEERRKENILVSQIDFENVNIITISISREKNLNFVTLNLIKFKLQIK